MRTLIAGTLVVHDIFEMSDDTDIGEATLEGMRRLQERAELERDMALSYHWNGEYLRRVNEGGLLMNDQPAPIPAEDYRGVLAQLADHPNYKHQRIVVVTEDGTILEMLDGEINEREVPHA